jgi:hypothetical protein
MSAKHAKRAAAKSKKPKVDAAKIVSYVVEPEVERGNLELWRTPSRTAFATVRVRDHYENHAVDSAEFRDLLGHWIFTAMGEMPSEATLKKTVRTLRGQALYGATSVERDVFHRIAELGGCVYLDLSDESWRVVEVSPTGWRVAKDPPVRFTRSQVSRPLPIPEPGGNLEGLFDFVNIRRREHQVLFLAWLVTAMQTSAAYPILALTGSQGSAKTTACRIAAALIDEASPQMVSGYSTERDLLIDAQYSHVIAIDNVSEITNQLSDAYCRLSTGSGMRRRKLYSDSTLFALSAKNPLILNSISTVAARGDLLDRMLTLRLDPIPEDRRREEARVFAEFRTKRGAILGALLSAVSAGLARLPHLEVGNLHLPRMADFATWVIACERELGFGAGEFLRAYNSNRREASDTTLEFSAIGHSVMAVADLNDFWEGSIKQLLIALNTASDELDRRNPDWPKNERALASALHRIEANLHAAGYTLQFLKRDSRSRRRIIRIDKKSKPSTVDFRADAQGVASA